jgi:hypothetical protein
MGIAVQAGFMIWANFTADDFNRLRSYIQAMPPAQVTLTVYTPSPGSPAWRDEQGKFVCNPFELHDCMHPLTRTSLPLREFYHSFSSVVWLGATRSPLRAHNNRIRPRDMLRIWRAAIGYSRALGRAYRDYPKELQ